jgi:hypothetical protein
VSAGVVPWFWPTRIFRAAISFKWNKQKIEDKSIGAKGRTNPVHDMLLVEVEDAGRSIARHAHYRDERQLLLLLDLEQRIHFWVGVLV